MSEPDGTDAEDARQAEAESSAMRALVDESAFLSAEQQEHAAAVLGEHSWSVDALMGTFTAARADGSELVCRAHLLGTAAEEAGTWLWGWADVNGFPDPFTALAGRLRDAAADRGAPELLVPELPLVDALPDRLAVAAKSVLGPMTHYAAPVDDGTRVWLSIDHRAFALPAPTVLRASEAIQSALSGLELTDHCAALRSWARQRGAPAERAFGLLGVPPEKPALRVRVSDGEFVATFDALGRIDGLRADLSGGPEPSPADARIR